MRNTLSIKSLLISLTVLFIATNIFAEQIDFTGSDEIDSQTWKISFVVENRDNLDSFYVRLPYPNYTMKGRWAEYSTYYINASAIGECGPIGYEINEYNIGYSNQGIWMKIKYPCYRNSIQLTIKQSVTMRLPGVDYALSHFTNNDWVNGTYLVDVYSTTVNEKLNEAHQIDCEFHNAGFWYEPEQVTNWMMANLQYFNSDEIIPASQAICNSGGDCDDWAHIACALLNKAGIPAKFVLCGMIPVSNAVGFEFTSVGMHAAVAYWDGYGWILMDPDFGSGFGIITRVILGADQDIEGVRITAWPINYENYIVDVNYNNVSGFETSFLNNSYPRRCWFHWQMLEHYHSNDTLQYTPSEPINNIIPNVVTGFDNLDRVSKNTSALMNYPNPFNPNTTFKFKLKHPSHVVLDIFSVDGKKVDTVINRYLQTGVHIVPWNAKHVASGVYFARLNVAGHISVRKVIVIK